MYHVVNVVQRLLSFNDFVSRWMPGGDAYLNKPKGL